MLRALVLALVAHAEGFAPTETSLCSAVRPTVKPEFKPGLRPELEPVQVLSSEHVVRLCGEMLEPVHVLSPDHVVTFLGQMLFATLGISTTVRQNCSEAVGPACLEVERALALNQVPLP